ncbi:MAG: tetratricopeptide repeat protein [Candidatus Omnitrophica bacterium]|nr:tetratricopeptide repeat protein [Candidatus Omnitrophota bacterium]
MGMKKCSKVFLFFSFLALMPLCQANGVGPDAYESSWRQAEALRRQHRLKESEEIVSVVLKKHPDFAPAIVTLAQIRYTQEDFYGTARLAARALKLARGKVDEDSLVRAYVIYGLTKGMLAYYGGPLSKTIDGLASAPALKKAQKLRPNDPFVLFGVGSYHLLAPVVAGKDLKKAEEYLKKAVAADPLFVDAYVRLAQVYKAVGDEKKYRQYLDRALAIDPQNELALDINSAACRFVCP